MSKKNKKKQVKTSKKVVNKATTPAEEKVTEVDTIETTENEELNKEAESQKESTGKENKSSEIKESKDSKANKKEAKKDSKKSDDKNKKSWFKGFKAELKKVIWPNKKELFDNTTVVIIVVAIVSVLIFALDLLFGALTKFEVKQIEKLKNETTNSIVENQVQDNQTTEGDNSVEGGESNEKGTDLTNVTE